MGSRGPVPKRSDQRRRTNKNPDGEITKAPAGSLLEQADRKRKADRERIAAKRAAAREGRDSDTSRDSDATARPVQPGIPAADPLWHRLIRDLYDAVGRSGQAAFYEPSDYAMLRIGCEIMSAQLESGRPSAVMFASWDALMARLLVTEGDRRRMRLELERAKPKDPDRAAGVASMEEWRDRLAGDG